MTSLAPPFLSEPEVPDNAGTPREIASLYADIRSTLDTGVVNLVFRRLAGQGVPVLAMVWHCLRPAYADGRLDALAARLALPPPGAAALAKSERANHPARHWANRPEAAALRRILLDYDRNNRRNLIAFTALFAQPPWDDGASPLGAHLLPSRVRSAESRPAPAPDPWSQAMSAAALADTMPPLPDIAVLDAQTAACLARLDRFGDPGAGPPHASLYRHLAHWPAFLHAAEAYLAPLGASGALERATADVLAQANDAARLLPDLVVGRGMQTRLEPAIGALVRRTIPKMIPIGRSLGAFVVAPAAGHMP